jgi:DNA polymerase III subunit delta
MKQNLNDLLASTTENRVYLLHSPESCSIHLTFLLERLQKKIFPTTKYQFQVDRYFKFAEIDNILDNISLFAEQNIIELNFKTKPLASQEEDLLKLIKRIDTNSFLFITTDKLSATSSSWIKKINEIGIVIGILDTDTVPIIHYLLKEAKIAIDTPALNLLLELNHGNIPELMQEINRLILLHHENYIITVDDIQKVDNAIYNIYTLSNAYLAGDLAKSQEILENIFREAADAILIMWIMNEDVKKLLKIKAKLKAGTNLTTAITELRIWGDAINNFKIGARRISYNTLLEVLDMLANLDMNIKGVKNDSPKLLLLTIIKTLCKK